MITNLAEFVSDHVYQLTGVNTQVATGGDAGSISFILDGVTYTAVEDPDDGYRSSMRELQVGSGHVPNRFPPCQVRAVSGDWDSDGTSLVQFEDVVTGKTVLSVGTSNADDYYPSFVANFDPTAMAQNQPGFMKSATDKVRERPQVEPERSTEWASW